jgi:ParB family chromosome partitioning protein
MDNQTLSSPADVGDYRLVPLASITVGTRLRALRHEKVSSLTESITMLGLQTAISVAKDSPGADGLPTFALIDGNHRLEACKRLGWETVPARVVELDDVKRQVAEIDANLCRAELTELERGEHLQKRKELYEQLHPETRQHVAGAMAANTAMQRGNATATLARASFANDTAAKTRISGRSVQRSIARVNNIDPAVRDRIRSMPDIADNGTELDTLASLGAEDQLHAINLVEAGECKSVKAAKRTLNGPQARSPAPSRHQQTPGLIDPKLVVGTDPKGAEGSCEKSNDFPWEAGARQLIDLLFNAARQLEGLPDEPKIIDLLRYCGFDDYANELRSKAGEAPGATSSNFPAGAPSATAAPAPPSPASSDSDPQVTSEPIPDAA